MEWIKNHKLQILMGCVVALQAILSVFVLVQIIRLNMLPDVYVAVIVAVLVLLLAGMGALIFIPEKNGNKRKIIGMAVSAALSVILLIASIAIGKVLSTLEGITGDPSQSNVIAVYVRADDSAENIQDAIDYKFGIDQQFDKDNALLAKASIEEETGRTISPAEYDNVLAMIDDLLSGETDAIILNAAYIDVLVDVPKYKKIKDKVKVVYEYTITEQVPETESESEEVKLPITERPFIVYISGSDTRNSKLTTSRSDVNLLAVINPLTKQILLLNTPRDYYVLTAKSNFTQYDKLTHCGIYGTQCSMDTLGYLYGKEIEFYGQINFEGFSRLVDAIGGITVDSDKSFRSEDGYQYAKGLNTLNGAMALSFVRERHAFADGDIQRGKDQMKAIKAIMDKVKSSPGMLTNYGEILDSLEGMFATNVSSSDMGELVKMQLDDGSDWNVVSYGVFGKGKKMTTYTVPNKKAYVMLQDEAEVAKAKALIDKVYNGETLTEVE